jgi:hypothetical protein
LFFSNTGIFWFFATYLFFKKACPR